MPELPEVETVRRVLAPQVAGRRICAVYVVWPGILARPAADPAAFAAAVCGHTVTGMERRGKFLALLLDGGGTVRLHLRMTGQLLLCPPGWPDVPHTHLAFELDDGSELRYADARRFGRFWYLAPGEPDTYSGVAQLGPEPFDPALTPAYLRGTLGGRRAAIKNCLLDQRVVAGIGNIYSDEILFAVRIRPDRPACTLTAAEWRRLAAEIPAQLRQQIEWNGISPTDYLAGSGQDYRNTPHLQVYGRGGAVCPRCGKTQLRRIVIAGRSSVFCPRCQRLPRVEVKQ